MGSCRSELGRPLVAARLRARRLVVRDQDDHQGDDCDRRRRGGRRGTRRRRALADCRKPGHGSNLAAADFAYRKPWASYCVGCDVVRPGARGARRRRGACGVVVRGPEQPADGGVRREPRTGHRDEHAARHPLSGSLPGDLPGALPRRAPLDTGGGVEVRALRRVVPQPDPHVRHPARQHARLHRRAPARSAHSECGRTSCAANRRVERRPGVLPKPCELVRLSPRPRRPCVGRIEASRAPLALRSGASVPLGCACPGCWRAYVAPGAAPELTPSPVQEL